MPETTSRPFIRHYDAEKDFANVVHVFRETCDEALKTEPIWTIGFYIWCRPYLLLSPATCFVLDNGSGTAVGYIIGTSDSQRFCASWEREYVPLVKDEITDLASREVESGDDNGSKLRSRDNLTNLILTNPEDLIYGERKQMLSPWPGHLHIDILPSYHRQGHGKALMTTFLEALEEGCHGVHLGMIASNSVATAFYEANGFQRLPQVLDGGASGEMGRTEKAKDSVELLYYVKDL